MGLTAREKEILRRRREQRDKKDSFGSAIRGALGLSANRQNARAKKHAEMIRKRRER